MTTATTEHTKTTYAKGEASFSGSVLLPISSIALPDGSKAKQAGFASKLSSCITQMNSYVAIRSCSMAKQACSIVKMISCIMHLFSSVMHLISSNFRQSKSTIKQACSDTQMNKTVTHLNQDDMHPDQDAMKMISSIFAPHHHTMFKHLINNHLIQISNNTSKPNLKSAADEHYPSIRTIKKRAFGCIIRLVNNDQPKIRGTGVWGSAITQTVTNGAVHRWPLHLATGAPANQPLHTGMQHRA